MFTVDLGKIKKKIIRFAYDLVSDIQNECTCTAKTKHASTDALTFISKRVLNTWIFILWLGICLHSYAHNGVLTMSSKPLSLSIVAVCKAYQIPSEGELHLALSQEKCSDNI
jgi:hypothetical protein